MVDIRADAAGPLDTSSERTCDYSLHGVKNRPAKVNDMLVSTNFVNSLTRGFTAVGEPKVAVCLLPGTELAFDKPVEVENVFRRILPFLGFGQTGQTTARFRQINMDRPDTHHDALEFPNGQIVLVTRLCTGQKATVLQLPIKGDEKQAEGSSAAGTNAPTPELVS